jgi:hypothetical protein
MVRIVIVLLLICQSLPFYALVKVTFQLPQGRLSVL